MEIKAIIWDLGNVLIDWNPAYVFNRLIEDPERRSYFFRHICTSDWNENQDAGRPIREATEELVQQHPEWKELIEAYYGQWTDMLGGPIQGTVDLFAELRASRPYKHYALTNWSAELFPIALERYDFLHWFDGRENRHLSALPCQNQAGSLFPRHRSPGGPCRISPRQAATS